MNVVWADLTADWKQKPFSRKLVVDALSVARTSCVMHDVNSFSRPTCIAEAISHGTSNFVWVEAHAFVERGKVILYPSLGRNNLKLPLRRAVQQVKASGKYLSVFVIYPKADQFEQVSTIIQGYAISRNTAFWVVSSEGRKRFREFGLPIYKILALKILELSEPSKIFKNLLQMMSGLQRSFDDGFFAHYDRSVLEMESIIADQILTKIPSEFLNCIESNDLGDVQDDIQELAHYLQDDDDADAQLEAILALLGAQIKEEFRSQANIRELLDGLDETSISAPPIFGKGNSSSRLEIAFVQIPAGTTKIGVNMSDYPAEGPEHSLYLDEFSIGRTPLTRRQFRSFVIATGYVYDFSRWQELDVSDEVLPANYLSLSDGLSFCKWATAVLRSNEKISPNQNVTIPSEVQWERSARGQSQTLHPWGDDFDSQKCNCKASGIGHVSSVYEFEEGSSDEGVLDLIGNVHEWTRSLWGFGNRTPDFRYPYDRHDGRERPILSSRMRYVVRGGAFYYRADCLNSFSRNYKFPGLSQVGSGLRLCLEG